MKETHSIQGFARLVAMMRALQREAERTFLAADIDRAATWGRRVDAAVREILAPQLFSEEDET